MLNNAISSTHLMFLSLFLAFNLLQLSFHRIVWVFVHGAHMSAHQFQCAVFVWFFFFSLLFFNFIYREKWLHSDMATTTVTKTFLEVNFCFCSMWKFLLLNNIIRLQTIVKFHIFRWCVCLLSVVCTHDSDVRLCNCVEIDVYVSVCCIQFSFWWLN